jgi:hypothetical protein
LSVFEIIKLVITFVKYQKQKKTFNNIKFNHNNTNYASLLETTLWERTALLDGSEWDCGVEVRQELRNWVDCSRVGERWTRVALLVGER